MTLRATRQLVAVAVAGAICAAAGFMVGRIAVSNHPSKALVSQAAPSLGKAPGGGVHVHGWWTLNVFKGERLVVAKQFENSLVTGFANGGDTYLADVLGGVYANGVWDVGISWAGGGTTLTSAVDGTNANTLTVSNSTPNHVILHGGFTPTADISITRVATNKYACPATTAPSGCTSQFGTFFFGFTGQTLATPLPVANGQQVQVTVDISFS